jgi:hypothetical protein
VCVCGYVYEEIFGWLDGWMNACIHMSTYNIFLQFISRFRKMYNKSTINQHTHTHTHIYIYMCVCVRVFGCVCVRERERGSEIVCMVMSGI